MYSLEPKLVESDYRGAFAATLSRFRRRTMLVVLTELAEQAVTQSLVPALPLIARDHLMVVASVTDPQVSQWATSSPLEPGAAYGTAAEGDGIGEEGDLCEGADADSQRGGPGPAGDEPLDGAGRGEGEDEPDDDHDGAPALLRQGRKARAVAGVDQGPAQAQPGRSGNEHAGQFEHAVWQDQPPEFGLLADGGEQPQRDAQVGPVDDQHVQRAHAQKDPDRERHEGDLDVVGEHRRRELAGRRGRVVGLEVVVDVGLPDGGRSARLDRSRRIRQPDPEADRG